MTQPNYERRPGRDPSEILHPNGSIVASCDAGFNAAATRAVLEMLAEAEERDE